MVKRISIKQHKYFIMKKLHYLFILFAIGLFSCEDDIDNLTETKVSTILSESFNVAISDDDPLTQSVTQTLNAGDNNDLNGVLSSVEEYEVTNVSFTVRNYTGADDIMLESAMITFAVDGGSSIVASAGNVTISSIVDVEQDLPFNSDALNALGETLLNNGGSATITAASTVSGAPASFTIEINLEITATVDVI